MARVVLTHPVPRIGPLASRLRAAGHRVLEMPVRRLEPLLDQRVAGALSGQIQSADWVVLASPGSVDAAWVGLPSPWPWHVGIAVVGAGTEQALLAHGFDPAQLRGPIVRPRHAPYDAATLMREAPFDAPRGLRVVVLRGERGREDWIADLRNRGALVECLAVHRSEILPITPAVCQRACRWLDRAAQDRVFFIFTTIDAIESLSAALPTLGREAVRALAVHPKLVAALRKNGWSQASLLEPGEAGLFAGLE